jgi:hypothetical protein
MYVCKCVWTSGAGSSTPIQVVPLLLSLVFSRTPSWAIQVPSHTRVRTCLRAGLGSPSILLCNRRRKTLSRGGRRPKTVNRLPGPGTVAPNSTSAGGQDARDWPIRLPNHQLYRTMQAGSSGTAPSEYSAQKEKPRGTATHRATRGPLAKSWRRFYIHRPEAKCCLRAPCTMYRLHEPPRAARFTQTPHSFGGVTAACSRCTKVSQSPSPATPLSLLAPPKRQRQRPSQPGLCLFTLSVCAAK